MGQLAYQLGRCVSINGQYADASRHLLSHTTSLSHSPDDRKGEDSPHQSVAATDSDKSSNRRSATPSMSSSATTPVQTPVPQMAQTKADDNSIRLTTHSPSSSASSSSSPPLATPEVLRSYNSRSRLPSRATSMGLPDWSSQLSLNQSDILHQVSGSMSLLLQNMSMTDRPDIISGHKPNYLQHQRLQSIVVDSLVGNSQSQLVASLTIIALYCITVDYSSTKFWHRN